MVEVFARGKAGSASNRDGADGGRVTLVLDASLSFQDSSAWPVLDRSIQLGDGEFRFGRVLPTAAIRIGGEKVTILCAGDFEAAVITNVTSAGQTTPSVIVYSGGQIGTVKVYLDGKADTSGRALPGGTFEFYGRCTAGTSVSVSAQGGAAYSGATPAAAGGGGRISVAGPDEELGGVLCFANGGPGGVTAGIGSGSTGGRGGEVRLTATSMSIRAETNGGAGASGSASANSGVGGRGGNGGCIRLAIGPTWTMAVAQANGGVGGAGHDGIATGSNGGSGGNGGVVVGLSSDHVLSMATTVGGAGGSGGYGSTRGGDGGRGGESTTQPGAGGSGGTAGAGGTRGKAGASGAVVSMSECQAESAIVFVPGIAGTELYDQTGLLWPTVNASKLARLDLVAPPFPFPVIRTGDVVRQAGPFFLGFGETVVYQPLVALFERLGYVNYDNSQQPERRTFAGMFGDLKTRVDTSGSLPSLFLFPYDWRVSNTESAQRLAEYVRGIRWLYPGCKIDFVAHSMGGLVLRRFILDATSPYPPPYVGRVVTIGTPILGTPAGIFRQLAGDFYGMGLIDTLNNRTIVQILRGFPAAHELLPSATYFNLARQLRPAVFEELGVDFDGNGSMHDASLDTSGVFGGLAVVQGSPMAGVANSLFHTANQDDWSQDLPAIEYLHIVGLQTSLRTIVGLQAFPAYVNEGLYVGPRYLPVWGPGDGTVSVLSAVREPALLAPQKSATAVLRGSGEVDHTALCANAEVHNLIALFLRSGLAQVRSLSYVSSSASGSAIFVEEMRRQATRVLRFQGPGTEALASELARLTNASGGPLLTAISYHNGLVEVALSSGDSLNVRYTNSPFSVKLEAWDILSETVVRRADYGSTAPVNSVTVVNVTPASLVVAVVTNRSGLLVTNTVNPTAILTGADAADVWAPELVLAATNGVATLRASDTGTGVAGVFFSLDSGSYARYTIPVTVPFGSRFEAFAEDRVGNKSVPVDLDRRIRLRMERGWDGKVTIYWPKGSGTLQEASMLRGSTWANTTNTIQSVGDESKVIVGPRDAMRYFRVRR